ncbi:MAG: histidine kinase, partial [Polyangiales bacterium]
DRSAGPEGGSRRRLVFGTGVLLLVVLLQQVGQYITNRDLIRLRSVLLWFSLELPTLLFALSRLFAWSRRHQLRWGMFVGLGLLISTLLGAIGGGMFHLLSQAWPGLGLRLFSLQPALPVTLTRIVMYGLTQAQTHFGLWTLGFALPDMLEDARVRELQAQKLAAESQQLRSAAELARLRSHLEPHFLLNTLNAIAGLVTEDPRQARRLIAALGELLRDALKDEQDREPLSAQVEWLKRYAQILEARHRGDLSFSWEIAPETEHQLLPRLLLQPLVENAVKHGALRASGPGHVSVRTRVDDQTHRLVCTVHDNGPGIPDLPVRQGAFGVESVRRRLQLRYGPLAHVSLRSDNHGAVAEVEIPLRRSGAEQLRAESEGAEAG